MSALFLGAAFGLLECQRSCLMKNLEPVEPPIMGWYFSELRAVHDRPRSQEMRIGDKSCMDRVILQAPYLVVTF